MAAILDPKTRFFDTYITKEGRRQLSSGELRIRYVSFSDGLTGYEQSEVGVIDPKDGSIFFEAMSRPQDQIITENPSIVNMMSIRDPGRQPAFLHGPDGSRIQAAMFGDQIIKPPDGRKISVSTTAGIDKIDTEYDPNYQMYTSGSDTKEIQYKHEANLRGWWVFEDTMDQLADAGMQFSKNTIHMITTDEAATTSSMLTVDLGGGNQNVPAFKTAGNTFLFLKEIAVVRGIKVGDNLVYGSFNGVVADVDIVGESKKYVRIKMTTKSGSDQIIRDSIVGTIGVFLKSGDKVSENLKLNSSLSTNASYFKITGAKYVNESSPSFVDQHMPAVSPKVKKSWSGGANKAIRISLENSFYGIKPRPFNYPFQPGELSPDDFEDHTSAKITLNGRDGLEYSASSRIANQISTWFYLPDIIGDTQTLMVLYGHRKGNTSVQQRVRSRLAVVEIINNDLILKIYKRADPTQSISYTLADFINADTWHRVSLAWNFRYVTLVLDGDLSKSLRIEYEMINSEIESIEGQGLMQVSGLSQDYRIPSSISDLVLGNLLSSAATNVLNPYNLSWGANNKHFRGYIQSCEYYADTSIDNSRTPWDSLKSLGRFTRVISPMGVPVFNSMESFYKYDRFMMDKGTHNRAALNSVPPNLKTDYEIDENYSTANIHFATCWDSWMVTGDFYITLTDTQQRTVKFTAAPGDTNPTRINSGEYKFGTPQYYGEGNWDNRTNDESRVKLANRFKDAVELAKNNGELGISATIPPEINESGLVSRGKVELRQNMTGFMGDTEIIVHAASLNSIVKKDFSGGKKGEYYQWRIPSKESEPSAYAGPNEQSFEENKDDFDLKKIRNFAKAGTNYLDFYNLEIEADPGRNKWVDYYQISSETCLYQAGAGRSVYAKEKINDRDEIFPSLDELAKDVSLAMSGSIDSYKNLILLGHLDLEKSDENQGFEIERYEQLFREGEEPSEGRPGIDSVIERGRQYTQHETRVFRTRLDTFQHVEHVYGQQNDYRTGYRKPVSSLEGPASGLFFEKEATLINIEEILDNELDNDDNTRSSSRLPNFFVLPPVAKQNFIFENQDYKFEGPEADQFDQDNPPWRQYLNTLKTAGNDIDIATYVDDYSGRKRMGIIPQTDEYPVLSNLVNKIISANSDSNLSLINYLSRNANVPEINKIMVPLYEFNEEIFFSKTNFNQNTMVQMFELSNDGGKPTFQKLAIRDLGVFFRPRSALSGDLNIEDLEFSGTPLDTMSSRLVGEVSVVGPSTLGGDLIHAFSFGKIVRDSAITQPGTGIYYVPIFFLECHLGEGADSA